MSPTAYLGSDEVVREDHKRFLEEWGVVSAVTKDGLDTDPFS
ncbi:MAG: hypothetical protein U9N12_08600 [Euryarchaeota archaeon]|nr:hypothetical protein [Euryarchaeota archaeon]